MAFIVVTIWLWYMAKLLRRENISPMANGLSQKVGWNKMDAPGAKSSFSEQLVMQDQQQNLHQTEIDSSFPQCEPWPQEAILETFLNTKQ